MTGFGSICLLFVLALSAYAGIASVAGVKLRRPALAASGGRALVACFGLTTLSLAALWTLLYRSDFRVEYVWGHSNRDLPAFYKISSLWAGQEGSLLLWTWVLAAYAALVVVWSRGRHRLLMPWVVAVLASSVFFFALVNNFVANPFNEIGLVRPDGAVVDLPRPPPDGRGLNPLLQHPAMVIHPPVLYFGYIGFIVPFAFCIAALITRQLGDTWIRTTRRWTLVTWSLLGSGILLGGRWAYVELGWGGYWAWDPVENASLMPWIVGTAFLHSVMIQEKRGMLKIWNVVLVLLTYTLAIFGTFTTRSGIMSSVHAFAQSSIGGWFVGYIVLLVAATGALLALRIPDLRTENRLESMLSRESAFLFNNVVLVVMAFAVFSGTMFPVISEAVTGEKIVVGAPFFNKVMTPLGLILLFLTGVGPLVPWRRGSFGSLWRNLALPLGVGAACAGLLIALGMRHPQALACFGLSAFVLATIVIELVRGGRARARSLSAGFVTGLLDLLRRNKRRYGGYLVHVAMVCLFVGFAGKAFETETKVPVKVGDTISLRGYDLRIRDLVENDRADPNYIASRMIIDLEREGAVLASLKPESRFYAASEQSTTEVARWSGLHEDVYAVFVRTGADSPPEVQVFVNPLIRFVWLGGYLLALGALMTLMPNLRRTAGRAPTAPEPTALAHENVPA